MEILRDLILNGIIFFYHILGDNFGLAVIGFTVALKFVLVPLSIPQIKMSVKQRELAPEMDKIKEKFQGDKQKLAKEQMDLFKKHGVNPFAGCLPLILQAVVLLALFYTFMDLAENADVAAINNRLYTENLHVTESFDFKFLYLDLGEPDPIFLLPILTAIAQFYASKMMLPAAQKAEKDAKKTKGMADDLMAGMQMQMLYIFPIMTLVIGVFWPSGIVLYWFVSTLFMFIQYHIMYKVYSPAPVKS